MNQEPNNAIPVEATQEPLPTVTPETTPIDTPEVAVETVPETTPIVTPEVAVETVPETTPEAVLPPEPELPTEEPVMIAANIDEIPEGMGPLIPTPDPVVEVPTITPDLGNPNTEKQESVPTFQQFPTAEEQTKVAVSENSEPTDIVPETTPVESPNAVMENQMVVPLPTQEEETYQATSNQMPAFQKLGDVPVETPAPATEELPEEEEDTDVEPKKKRKILPLIIIGILLILVIIVGVIGLKSKGQGGGNIPSLKPERSAEGNINIAVVGHVDSPKADVYSALTKYFGTEMSKADVENCQDISTKSLTIQEQNTVISTESRTYNLIYLCNFLSTQEYMISSDGEDTIDGMILVVSAKEGIMPQTREIVSALSKADINKLAIYIINDGDTTKVTEEVKELLKKNSFDTTNTPIVTGGATDESTLKDLMKRVDSWINKITEYNGPAAIENHKKMKIYTYLKASEVGGLSSPLKENDTIQFEILDEKINGKISLEEGVDKVSPGEVAELTVKLDKNTPLEKGMRIEIYKDDSIIGIGVVSELD